ncbi:MAG: ATP-binding protein [Clostridiales bacterium]|jgi:DNA replication protein DnaC|nr:ATP-binding protein [Clostridiales bacterium]
MTGADIMKDIRREYERDRAAAESRRGERQAEIYAEIPRVAEIDAEISRIGIAMTRRAISGGGSGGDGGIGNLTREREGLLAASRFPADYLTNVHKCPKCHDTGRAGAEECDCLKARVIDAYCGYSGLMSDVFARENFDTFDITLYSASKDPKFGVSPRQSVKAAYALCVKFCADFGEVYKNLLFYGSAGLGKTFMLNCVAGELLRKGRSVVYQTAGALFKRVEELRFGARENAGAARLMELVMECDLLIIDDLGAEFATSVTIAELFNIINTRLLSRRPVCISTNLTPDELKAQYSERIVSRLHGDYVKVAFFGEDIRLGKRYGRV